MKVCHIVFGSGAAFYEMKISPFIKDDKGMLKLSRTGRVQSEIALQRDLNLYTFGHVYKGSARPYCAVKCGKFVIRRRDELHKVILYHLLIFAVHCALKICIYHSQLFYILTDIVIYKLAVILCAHSCKGFPLSLGYSQSFKGLFYLFGHFAPFTLHGGVGADIGIDLVHIEPAYIRAPLDHLCFVVNIESFKSQFKHPPGIVLFL